MAKALNMQFSGSIGPLVGCLRDGKYYYRSRPGKVRQTEATKNSSSIFALASKAGKIMRQQLGHSIPDPRDIHMQRQLVGRISNWLRLSTPLPPQPTADIPFVNHFNFNPSRPLDEALQIPLSFIKAGPGHAQLQMPAFVPRQAIKAPAHTAEIEICICAVALRLGIDNGFGNTSLTITIPYTDIPQLAQQVDLPLQTEPGNILIAALQLRFTLQAGTKPKYVAAGKLRAAIVGAIYL